MGTSLRYIRVVAATLLSLGILLVVVGTVSAHPTHTTHTAHAKVTMAMPTIGSTITEAPTMVTAIALENIKPQGSSLLVYAPNGDLISQGNATFPLSSPKDMSVKMKPSGNGVYIVRWATVSADDGDPDQGAFIFTVKPVVTATPTATSNGTTTPTTTTAGTSGIPLWVPILIGIVALLVGVGAGFGIGRNTGKKPSTLSSMRQTVAAQPPQTDEFPTKRS